MYYIHLALNCLEYHIESILVFYIKIKYSFLNTSHMLFSIKYGLYEFYYYIMLISNIIT